MPNFGQSDILTEDEITRLAAFLQLAPPEAPPLPMDEILSSWNLLVPISQRPTAPQQSRDWENFFGVVERDAGKITIFDGDTAPQHSRDWENFFGVVERDAGKITIFDGDTQEKVVQVDVGFAVHILRSSATGRYFYAIGRDGLVTLIDLWASTPNVVATVKGCHDARSVDGSKFEGYEDAYLIEGCYWPPQYVVYDGLTLEPLARQDLPMESITGETLPEVRVASIVSSHFKPLWAISLKESGYVGLVDYSQQAFPLVSTIATERFLHDGGFDHTGRYFLVAANASNKMVVVDIASRSFVTSISTGTTPHPGRGANWYDPVYGWVNATPHIGEPKVGVSVWRRSGESSGACLEGGAGDRVAGRRHAFPQDPPELTLGAVRHDPECRSRQAGLRLFQGNRNAGALLRCSAKRQGGALRIQQGRQRGLGVGLGT
jgi:nitrite reductase (NO-forming)/hydroxylamine reductase